nr:uncharacterized protein LOC111426278 [Onthophagus taurus]XP_022916520.1 uncharacterized protein LOC111426278 [Onthophagus taurus]
MDSQILLFHRYKGDCVCCAYKPILKLCCFIGLIPVNFHCNHHNHSESRFTYKVSKLSVLIAIFVVLYLLLAAMKVTIHVFEQTNIFDVMISLSFVIIVWPVLTTYCFVVISYRKVASLVIKTLLDFHNCFIQTENTTSKNLIKTARRKSMVYVILITIWVPISTLIACATIENLQNALLIISADFIFQLIVFVGISYIDVHVAAISYLYKNILSKIDAKIRENERINLNFRQIRFIYKNIFDNQSFFNKFISIIFCVYVPAASMIVIIGFCGINEMIETNFHLSLFILITFWFIDAIVAIIYMLVAEDLHEKVKCFNLILVNKKVFFFFSEFKFNWKYISLNFNETIIRRNTTIGTINYKYKPSTG